MAISEKSQPDGDDSTVVGIESQRVDASSIDGLVDRNYVVVYRYAYRLSGCATTAEDITQEVFVKAIAHLDQLRRPDAERGWLMSITRREFMRWLREIANPVGGRPVPLDTDQVAGEEGQVRRLDDADWVQTALGLLNEDARVVLLMYYFEELSYAEIARQLQIPIGTVMSRLSRGRDYLRLALERATDGSRAVASAVGMPLSPLLTKRAHGLLAHEVTESAAQEAKHG